MSQILILGKSYKSFTFLKINNCFWTGTCNGKKFKGGGRKIEELPPPLNWMYEYRRQTATFFGRVHFLATFTIYSNE